MTHKLSIEAIKTLLIACHEAKRVVELQPPLPEGLTPGNLKCWTTLNTWNVPHNLQRSATLRICCR